MGLIVVLLIQVASIAVAIFVARRVAGAGGAYALGILAGVAVFAVLSLGSAYMIAAMMPMDGSMMMGGAN